MPTFLKKELEDAGYIVKEPIDQVLVVEDFANSEELKHVFSVINSLTEDDWKIEYTKNLTRFCLQKFGRDDVENLVKEGKFEITQGWQDKNYLIYGDPIITKWINKVASILNIADPSLEQDSSPGMITLQRMPEGVELKAHTDQHTDPSISYATILYLNDDYVAGELFFSNKDLELKPKAGTLVFFPGTDEFNHGVRHVGKGPIRYVLVGFIKVIDFYKENKY
jgi:hypothetical protein